MKVPAAGSAVLTAVATLVVSQPASAGWTDDWLASQTSTPAGAYDSQQRGYYTGGGFSARWKQTEEHPITVSPPRVKFGCGGIDAYLGGFSYLDGDYLTAKFKKILGPGIVTTVFQLALDEFCKECTAAMNTLEQLTDALNNIAVNDCAASKTLVYAAAGYDSVSADQFGVDTSAFNIRQNYQRNYQDVVDKSNAKGGVPSNDMKPATDGCPNEFKDVFLGGSVVLNISNKLGIPQYAPIIRGYIGDAIVTPLSDFYQAEILEACPGNEKLASDDFLEGNALEMSTSAACTPHAGVHIHDYVTSNLADIAARLRAGTPMTAGDQAFINLAPIPVYSILKQATAAGTLTETVDAMAEPLSYAYSYKLLDDLYKAGQSVMDTASKISRDHNSTNGNPDQCSVSFVQGAIDWAQKTQGSLQTLRKHARDSYVGKMTELNANMQVAQHYRENERKTLNQSKGAK